MSMDHFGQSAVRHPRPLASKLRLNRKAFTPHQDHNSKRLLLA